MTNKLEITLDSNAYSGLASIMGADFDAPKSSQPLTLELVSEADPDLYISLHSLISAIGGEWKPTLGTVLYEYGVMSACYSFKVMRSSISPNPVLIAGENQFELVPDGKGKFTIGNAQGVELTFTEKALEDGSRVKYAAFEVPTEDFLFTIPSVMAADVSFASIKAAHSQGEPIGEFFAFPMERATHMGNLLRNSEGKIRDLQAEGITALAFRVVSIKEILPKEGSIFKSPSYILGLSGLREVYNSSGQKEEAGAVWATGISKSNLSKPGGLEKFMSNLQKFGLTLRVISAKESAGKVTVVHALVVNKPAE